jgi:CHAT domain-containing protein/Tfp pilus assembly protein PilF
MFQYCQEINSTPALIDEGVVVDSVLPALAGAKAGVRPGDLLLHWSRGERHGTVGSPFDLLYIMIEEGSRGGLRLEGLRSEKKQTWRMGPTYWGITVRPNFRGQWLSFYQEEERLAQANKLREALAQWKTAASSFSKSQVPWLGPWFLSNLADISVTHQWESYDDAYREALQEANGAGQLVKPQLLKQWAVTLQYRDSLAEADRLYREVIAEYRKLGDRTMAVSNALKQMGAIAFDEGDFARAGDCFEESIGIAEELAPRSIQLATDLIGLGALSQMQGDFTIGERYYQRALAIERSNFPESQDIDLILRNLGILAARRGDLAKEEVYLRKGLIRAEKLGARSLYSANILSSLAECLLDLGRPADGERYEKRALAIREKGSSRLNEASSLRNMGKIARVRGDLVAAQRYYERALGLVEPAAPESPDAVRIFIGLGYVARDIGDFITAEDSYRRALTILEKIAPASMDHAEALADLASAIRSQGRFAAAVETYKQAIAEMESKTSTLGGIEEDRSRYRAAHERYYKEYVDLLAQEGETDLAFETLESFHARTLVEMLSASQINLRAGVDPALVAREHELRKLLNAKTQFRVRLFGQQHSDDQLSALDRELVSLRQSYDDVEAQIRADSPTYASFTEPPKLAIRDIQQLLDRNTVLLEYSLGEVRSHIWIVSEHAVDMLELPGRAEIERLARQYYDTLTIRAQKRVADPNAELSNWHKTDALLQSLGAKISRMILAPVVNLIACKRLLIVGDGALQYVPFSALPAPGTQTVPLIVNHEIVILPSASVLAEIRRTQANRSKPSREVAVLADPVFDKGDMRVVGSNYIDQSKQGSGNQKTLPLPAERLSRSAVDAGLLRGRGSYFKRLPYTRQEAHSIVAAAPRGQAIQALDFQASRAMAMSLELARYRIVHFATHGLVDSKHPDLSGLVLSLVNRHGKPQDGFLGLEDIYNMKLSADLVVLSACQTALGEQISGEGLIGLTRGFMYAGASRVAASLWEVNDAATAELMAHFYKAMELDGVAPAAALRQAQLAMWNQRLWHSPYYWAGFQIQGEWK